MKKALVPAYIQHVDRSCKMAKADDMFTTISYVVGQTNFIENSLDAEICIR